MTDHDMKVWVITLDPYTVRSGAVHLDASMAITTLERHRQGVEPVKTQSSPHGLIADRIHETHGYAEFELENQRLDAAAKEMKAALDKNPVPFSEEETQKVEQVEALLAPHMPDAHSISLEVITALRWEQPFVMNGGDIFPLSPADCEPDYYVAPPVQVVHQQPFPQFPFLGFAQLWGGEVLSVAVGREPGTDLLRVVTLDEHLHPYDDSGIYSFWRFSVLHVPDRFFRVDSTVKMSCAADMRVSFD